MDLKLDSFDFLLMLKSAYLSTFNKNIRKVVYVFKESKM